MQLQLSPMVAAIPYIDKVPRRASKTLQPESVKKGMRVLQRKTNVEKKASLEGSRHIQGFHFNIPESCLLPIESGSSFLPAALKQKPRRGDLLQS